VAIPAKESSRIVRSPERRFKGEIFRHGSLLKGILSLNLSFPQPYTSSNESPKCQWLVCYVLLNQLKRGNSFLELGSSGRIFIEISNVALMFHILGRRGDLDARIEVSREG